MQLRLVELGPVFRPLARTVRDIATAQGKRVRLVTEGDDVEVDASIVHQLRDPGALEQEARKLGMVRQGERAYVIEDLPK